MIYDQNPLHEIDNLHCKFCDIVLLDLHRRMESSQLKRCIVLLLHSISQQLDHNFDLVEFQVRQICEMNEIVLV